MEPSKHREAGSGSGKKNPVIGLGMVAGGAVILIIAVLFGVFLIGNSGGGSAVSPHSCGQRVMAYVNANMVPQGTSAELISVTAANDRYEIITRYQGTEIPLYATRDCMFFTTGTSWIPLPGTCDTGAGTCSPAPVQSSPITSSRPTVELYVMSFCPYGVQVENTMKPVVDLLGDFADIRVRYIATVTGESITSAGSLHGNAEAVEDARQLCIAKYAPADYWNYLMAFNTRCYPTWYDAGTLDPCRNNVSIALSIPVDIIDRCAAGSEGLHLLKTDESSTLAVRAFSSPTLLINGQRYGGARTSEAIKQAICSHFDAQPSACDTVLSSQATTLAGSC
jgi:glutaredoxin